MICDGRTCSGCDETFIWSWSDALLVDVYMQGELAVTYKVRDAIPLVLTEQPACHEKAGALR